MTYSEVVQLLSSHMVPSDNNTTGPADSIPILEKFSLASAPGSGLQETDSMSAGIAPIPIIDQKKQMDNQPHLYSSAQPMAESSEIQEEVGKSVFSVDNAMNDDGYKTGNSMDQHSTERHLQPSPQPGQEANKPINDITNSMQRFTAFAGPGGNKGMHAHRPDQLSS